MACHENWGIKNQKTTFFYEKIKSIAEGNEQGEHKHLLKLEW